ncbi:apj1p [Saccharomyces arboricola H-6]|uniref:Apj1p n=1 Tax=Saccharomyces arboricola (strain H-6 / AS 2.3317 / CBS 10644) TaxID=1160507 RepID=J8PX45_SACAR|nr:apj1p [Saccharomyces arboricola H-6]
MQHNTSLYDSLNVTATASTSEIKKAYRNAALKYHPDKNNHTEESKRKFQEICQAYEILQDNHLRSLYDRYGTTDEVLIQEQHQQQAQTETETQHWQANVFSPTANFDTGGVSFPDLSPGDLFAQFFNSAGSASSNGFKSNVNFSFNGSSTPNFPFGHGDGTNNLYFPPSKHSSNDEVNHLKRGPDIKHNLKCTLKELYMGKTAKLGLNRTRICQVCDGHGGLKKFSCETCKGQGVQTQTKYMGPLVQSWSQTCADCGGAGTFVKNKDICQQCQGLGFIKQRKILQVSVQPGACHNQLIVLTGEGDEVTSSKDGGHEKVIPGDVVITILRLKDPKFQVTDNCNLIYKKCKVDLMTSLCGGTVYIEGHPSGKLIKLEIIPGEVLKPGCFKTVEDMGMPKFIDGVQQGFGHLYVKFDVVYPERLEPENVVKLQKILANDKYVHAERSVMETTDADCYCDLERSYDNVEEHVLSSFEAPYLNDEVIENDDLDDLIHERDSRKRNNLRFGESNDSNETKRNKYSSPVTGFYDHDINGY